MARPAGRERLSERVSSALPRSDDAAFDADFGELGEKIVHGLQVGAERGRELASTAAERSAPYAEAALERGRELANTAAERGKPMAKKARKRGESWPTPPGCWGRSWPTRRLRAAVTWLTTFASAKLSASPPGKWR